MKTFPGLAWNWASRLPVPSLAANLKHAPSQGSEAVDCLFEMFLS